MTLAHRLRHVVSGYDVVWPCNPGDTPRRGHVHGLGNRRGVYHEGALVPHLPSGVSTFSLWADEGFWVNIARGRVVGWSLKPIHRVPPGTILRRGTRPTEARVA